MYHNKCFEGNFVTDWLNVQSSFVFLHILIIATIKPYSDKTKVVLLWGLLCAAGAGEKKKVFFYITDSTGFLLSFRLPFIDRKFPSVLYQWIIIECFFFHKRTRRKKVNSYYQSVDVTLTLLSTISFQAVTLIYCFHSMLLFCILKRYEAWGWNMKLLLA